MTKNTRLISRILDRVCKGWVSYEIQARYNKVYGEECSIRVFAGITRITYEQVHITYKIKQKKLKRTPTIKDLETMEVGTVIDFGELGFFILTEIQTIF